MWLYMYVAWCVLNYDNNNNSQVQVYISGYFCVRASISTIYLSQLAGIYQLMGETFMVVYVLVDKERKMKIKKSHVMLLPAKGQREV